MPGFVWLLIGVIIGMALTVGIITLCCLAVGKDEEQRKEMEKLNEWSH